MKTIKIILVIITIFTVAFFATGLIIKQVNFASQITIDKPLEFVFEEFNNPQNTKNWIHEVVSLDTIQYNSGKIGSIYKIVLSNGEQQITMTEKVKSYVKNEKVTLFFDAENMLKTDDYVFSEKDGKTVINLNTTCFAESHVLACMLPFVKGKLQKQSQSYLNNFKDFVEGNSQDISIK